MKTWWAIIFGIIGGLLAAGILFLITRPPRGEPVTLNPPASPPPLVVHIVGAVRLPGVYQFQESSRVQDAILAAGGLRADANPEDINLASFLEDGQQLIIPSLEVPTSTGLIPTDSRAIELPLTITSPTPGLVNINTATQQELESLPGIGPVTAQKILAYREANGPFAAIEDIQSVSGIGPVIFEKIKNLITVNNSGQVP